MKTLLLFNLLIVLVLISYSQKRLQEFKAFNGIIYKKGDTVKLGLGSAANGNFLYLQAGGWVTVMYPRQFSGDKGNIGIGYANTGVIIKKIKIYNVKGIQKVEFIVGGGNISNYSLDIQEAIQTCEVTPCNNKLNTFADDNYDKIKKLQTLLLSGAITQIEYNDQKKRLLEKL